MKYSSILLLCALLLVGYSTILDDIAKLRGDLYASYWSKNQTFQQFSTWDRLKGLFPSDIHFNFVDSKNTLKSTLLRQHMKIDDENMFVTSFVLYGLL